MSAGRAGTVTIVTFSSLSLSSCRRIVWNSPSVAISVRREASGGADSSRVTSPVIVWLNLNSKQEVDELFERWKDTGAKIIEAVEDKPWNLREFRVADLDGNQLRVFYDFNWELSEARRR